MSASLVGSEMCIRDRRKPVRVPLVGEPSPAPEEEAGSAAAARFNCSRACLLYTSDAADDM
eukprot:2425579-Alexandrium_andersonii.AAC.1